MAKKHKPAAKPDPDQHMKLSGRPRILPAELDTRKQVRCSSEQLERWMERSAQLGFPDVSAWIRKACEAEYKRGG